MNGILMTGEEARSYLGLTEYRWYKLKALIPQWTPPMGGKTMYSKLALDEWARTLGRAA